MGLAEKRAIKSFQEGTYKKLEGKIFEIAGKNFKIEIDWNSIAEDGMSHMYEEAFQKVYFSPLIDTLESICSDAMGKEAVSDGMDKIVIENKKDNTSALYWATFDNKVLTLDHKPFSNVEYISDRSTSLQKVLEDNL